MHGGEKTSKFKKNGTDNVGRKPKHKNSNQVRKWKGFSMKKKGTKLQGNIGGKKQTEGGLSGGKKTQTLKDDKKGNRKRENDREAGSPCEGSTQKTKKSRGNQKKAFAGNIWGRGQWVRG